MELCRGTVIAAVCGYGGSGKTSLLEALIPKLAAEGISLCVIKSITDKSQAGKSDKDSERLFRAGANVLQYSSKEIFFRKYASEKLPEIVLNCCGYYDLCLVEAESVCEIPAIWLQDKAGTALPENIDCRLQLPWNSERPAVVLNWIRGHLQACFSKIPVYAGLLLGGGSTRMGRAKHELMTNNLSWLEHIAGVLGQVSDEVILLNNTIKLDNTLGLKTLPDQQNISGPLAGMLSAMQWNQEACWIFSPTDVPLLKVEALNWMLEKRRFGIWGVMPNIAGRAYPEPLLAVYEPQTRAMLAQLQLQVKPKPRLLAESAKILQPKIPDNLVQCWQNINSPEDIRQFSTLSK